MVGSYWTLNAENSEGVGSRVESLSTAATTASDIHFDFNMDDELLFSFVV
jgi:hypothetical protein